MPPLTMKRVASGVVHCAMDNLGSKLASPYRQHALMPKEHRLEAWEFFKDDAGCWRWCRVDVVEQHRQGQSPRGFMSRNDCIADAMRHGYLADRIAEVELIKHP
jgi:hypothetical protein